MVERFQLKVNGLKNRYEYVSLRRKKKKKKSQHFVVKLEGRF